MKPDYPGDIGGDKAVSRLLLYQLAIKKIPIQGHAITLAGSTPEHEIILMRDYLRWPGSKTWFVDNSKSPGVREAIQRIKMLWPESNVSQNDIRDVIPTLGHIGFANMDLMGFPLSDTSTECISLLSKSMLPGSIFGLTWIKGRENMRLHKSAQMLWNMGKGFHGNERRWAGLEKAVSGLSSGSLTMINRWEYHNNHSPMCVGVFAKSA